MALIPTTFLRSPDFSKEMLRGIANAQMGLLLNQMRLGNLNCGRRVVEYASGVSITCTVNFWDRHLDIVVPENLGGENISVAYVAGFLCHPNTSGNYDILQEGTDGIKPNKVLYFDHSDYYSDDKWHTLTGVVRTTVTDILGNIISISDDGRRYGNVDWKGPLMDAVKDPYQHERKVLTWTGPPSRYFPLNPETHYPGLTSVDFDTLLKTFYTPFSPYIYAHGGVLAIAPKVNYPSNTVSSVPPEGQVLGAAYHLSGVLVAVIKACHNSPVYMYELHALLDGAWVFQGGMSAKEVPRVPWFFNESGTEAVTVEGYWLYQIKLDVPKVADVWKWDAATVTTSVTDAWEEHSKMVVAATTTHADLNQLGPQADPSPNNQIIVGSDDRHSVGINTTGKVCMAADYKQDTLVKMEVQLSGSSQYRSQQSTQWEGAWSIIYNDNPTYPGPWPPETAWIGSLQTWMAPTDYLIFHDNGGFCRRVITVGGTAGAVYEPITQYVRTKCSCGGTVTVTATDANGCRTSSFTVSVVYIPPPDYPGAWRFYPNQAGCLSLGAPWPTDHQAYFILSNPVESSEVNVSCSVLNAHECDGYYSGTWCPGSHAVGTGVNTMFFTTYATWQVYGPECANRACSYTRTTYTLVAQGSDPDCAPC